MMNNNLSHSVIAIFATLSLSLSSLMLAGCDVDNSGVGEVEASEVPITSINDTDADTTTVIDDTPGLSTLKRENSKDMIEIKAIVIDELERIKRLDPDMIAEISKNPFYFDCLKSYGLDVDEAYTAALADFDYAIESIAITGDTAQANVVFIIKDLDQFQTILNDKGEELKKDPTYRSSDDDQQMKMVRDMVRRAFKEQPSKKTNTIKIDLNNKDGIWYVESDLSLLIRPELFCDYSR